MSSTFVEHLANALSTITILTCLFLKVPQIVNVKEKRSADGIFVEALLMEITGFSIMVLYNITNRYSLLTYLEYPIILLQVYVLMYYVLKYKNLLALPIVPVATTLYAIAFGGFALGCLPKNILTYLVPFCTPLSGFAKVTYIYGIVKSEKADAVAIPTWVISVATNLARIFTVYVDSGDINLMINFFISTLLSAGVLFTALYYQNVCNHVPINTIRRRVKRKTSDAY